MSPLSLRASALSPPPPEISMSPAGPEDHGLVEHGADAVPGDRQLVAVAQGDGGGGLRVLDSRYSITSVRRSLDGHVEPPASAVWISISPVTQPRAP
jgi:hypothetical protein